MTKEMYSEQLQMPINKFFSFSYHSSILLTEAALRKVLNQLSKRIKNILDYNKEKEIPLIIFIDEIFKGTNYNDRIFGAKEVLKKLASLNCIVFLTTHDFELCEIKEKKINNYHFEEFYKENKSEQQSK